MRRALLLTAVLFAAGCGGAGASPESVVRAWSHELDVEDNEGAANLFAPGARVIQGGEVLVLRTHEDAVSWNAALPCSGQIVAITSQGDTATATFLLGDREHSKCDGPGERATAIFRVRKGKIVLWHQTSGAPPPPPSTV